MSRRRSQRVVNKTPTSDKSTGSRRGDVDSCGSPADSVKPTRRISARTRRNVIVDVEDHESNSNDSGLESASGGAEKPESLKTDSDEDMAQTDKDNQMVAVSPVEVPNVRRSKRGAVNEKKASNDKNDEFDETVPPLVDFMEILKVSPSSIKSATKCRPDNDKQSEQKMEDDQSNQKADEKDKKSDQKGKDDPSAQKMEDNQSAQISEDDQSTQKVEEDKISEQKMEDNQFDQKKEENKHSEQKMENDQSQQKLVGSEMTATGPEGPCNSEKISENGDSSGKLRSSAADAAGIFLAKTYRKTLVETEEYALNYISQEFHHPVISCFRELNKADISTILGNKLKKSCNRLEQSIVYLGLIDYMATINNNPIYGEPTKMSKNVSSVVQKTLLEFKNILGTWALSGDEQLSSRYSLILKYLRTLVPMFKKAGFDEELSGILNRIEKEVQQHRINQEKIKSMNTASTSRTDSEVKLTSSEEADCRTALNEIVLNVDLTIKLDDSDDDDVAHDKDAKNKIFGKPLKGSPLNTELTKKKPRKPKTNLDKITSESINSPKTNQLKPSKDRTPKSHMSTTKKSTSLTRPKSLTKVFQSTNSPKTMTVKRIAEEDLTEDNDLTKKRKTENGNIKINRNEGEPKSSIKNFFTQISSPSSQANVQNQSPTLAKEKQQVNAFALMMNRSREMAQKKKTDKMNAISVPSLKVDTVK